MRAAAAPSTPAPHLQHSRSVPKLRSSRAPLASVARAEAAASQQHWLQQQRRRQQRRRGADPRGGGVAAFALRESPQNVPQPEAVPAPGLSAREALEAQLKAIARNDDPWPLHGVNVMYEFCYDSGSLERSRYFGFSKDLYHMDHYQGGLYSFAPELVNCERYEVVGEAPGGTDAGAGGGDATGEASAPRPEELGLPPCARVAAFRVRVTPAGGGGGSGGGQPVVFDFVLAVQTEGLRAGCWQTKRLTRADEQ